MLKVKDKERILKVEREKQLTTDKEAPQGYQQPFQQKLHRPGDGDTIYSKC